MENTNNNTNPLSDPDRWNEEIKKTRIEDITIQTILDHIKEKASKIDFKEKAYKEVIQLKKGLAEAKKKDNIENEHEIKERLKNLKIKLAHYIIITIEVLLEQIKINKWDLCKHHDFIYIFNGKCWQEIETQMLEFFLGEYSEILGVPIIHARYFEFKKKLVKQFRSAAYLPFPENSKDIVLINVFNGTLEISNGIVKIRKFNSKDFLRYQLPFEYDTEAKCPKFHEFLNRVLPDPDTQKVLQEFIAHIFFRNGTNSFKAEKALILYGTGANGKSVFFEVINALLGKENVSNYSFQSLTDRTGYFRAKLATKLVNYASEITTRLGSALFKQMVSGEPIEARLPYGEPFILRHYAKLIFNCNELPRDVENTNAFYRRFLIIPFNVTIPENEQDKELHRKLIDSELSGVLNWVIEGLQRLVANKKFSECADTELAVKEYKETSNSVAMFLREEEYFASTDESIFLKFFYPKYRKYCLDAGFQPVNKANFKKRLIGLNIPVERINAGYIVYVECHQIVYPEI